MTSPALLATAPLAGRLTPTQYDVTTRDTHNDIVRPAAYATVAAVIGASVGGLWRQSWAGAGAGAALGAVLGFVASKTDS